MRTLPRTRSANAILGALGEGDLGRHFPDSDPRYKDANSLKLLIGGMEDRERPRLQARQCRCDDLRAKAEARTLPRSDAPNLAHALGADAKLLNVKASSPEGLGALGRGDGMAAAAIVVIES